MKAKQHVTTIRLAYLLAGQIFGEEDYVNGRDYTTTVKCSSLSATVFTIKSSEFTKQFSKDALSWEMILKNVR